LRLDATCRLFYAVWFAFCSYQTARIIILSANDILFPGSDPAAFAGRVRGRAAFRLLT